MAKTKKKLTKEEIYLEEKRKRANKHLPTLAKLLSSSSLDKEVDSCFVSFMQEVVDCYMMQECRLGRGNL